jgi:glycosyltransferase involved in cell wall biosynthesis
MRSHLQRRLGGAQPRCQVGRHPRRRSKQEQPKTTPRAERGERRNEIHAGDRLTYGAALPPGRPYDSCAVGQAQVGRLEHAGEVLVDVRPHDELGVDRDDEVVTTGIHQLCDPIECCIHVHAIDSHAKDADIVHGLIIIRRLSTKTIAVDLNPATREVVTGTEVFAREVGSRLGAAAPELRWRFFASRARAGIGVDLTVLPFPRLWSQVRLPVALARAHADLLFVPSHAIPFAWPGRALTVVHDLAFERFAHAYTPAARAYLQLTTRWAANRCQLLIAVSESTKSDLVALYGVKPDRIRVVPLGGGEPVTAKAAPASRLAELGLEGSFVLQVGRIEARKNQAAALAAVERLEGVTLAVAGPERDRALAARLRESRRCRVLGVVDQATLELLYQRADAVVVPSLYEGFGLPLLEAMARGKVVVATAASSLPEVGGDAALYVDDPGDAAALAKALSKALGDEQLRARLGPAAQARAGQFTWDRCAAGVVAVIRELVA